MPQEVKVKRLKIESDSLYIITKFAQATEICSKTLLTSDVYLKSLVKLVIPK